MDGSPDQPALPSLFNDGDERDRLETFGTVLQTAFRPDENIRNDLVNLLLTLSHIDGSIAGARLPQPHHNVSAPTAPARIFTIAFWRALRRG